MLNCLKNIPLFILAFLTIFSQQVYSKQYVNYTDFLNEILNLSVDYTNAYPVRDYFISKDVANISLDSGVVYLCKPVNNRNCFAIFVGKGTLNYEPPIKIEQDQLERYLKTKSLNAGFSSMLMFCGDSTIYDIMKYNLPVKAEHNKILEKMIIDFLKYEKKPHDKETSTLISKTLLEDEFNNNFYTYFDMDEYEDLFYCINQYEDEEINLLRGDWAPGFGQYNESINEFHYSNEYQNGEYENSVRAPNDEVNIEKYTIDCTIEDKLRVICNSKIDMVASKDGVNWLNLYLFDELRVNSVKSLEGKDLKFYKGDEISELWVKFPKEYKLNDTFSFIINYSGEILTRNYDYIFLKTSIGWYPDYGYRNHSYFDLTFHTPEEYEFVSIGDLVSEKKENGIYTSHWVMPYKVQLSMSFFTKLFGSLPIKKFYATELLAFHGEAFPGLIHLSSLTFWDQSKSGRGESFRSHEVAHQWWGISTDIKSYRDRWLSEGFAEYVSLMYTQMVLKDNEKFFDFLRRSREEIINLRKSFLGSGFEQGPIALGHRLSSSKTPGDYDLIIYEKGAWVLHMLRNYCINLNTLNEDVFFNIIKEFYHTYKGKYASTIDFQRIVEKYTGMEFGWFFDQWVYDTKIPFYKVANKYEKTPEGKYKIRIRVKQENVPPTFKMFVPIVIYGDENKSVRFRTFITNEVCEFELPLIPFEPEKIKFNEGESVLCDYEEEDWE
ncbi:MAG: hypothetical protein HZB41_10875 [Ignavibacteriae bacterium]|nr:hypothetical protein [Ignavibacteriota bacterium]